MVADHGASRCGRRQMQLPVTGHLELRGGLVSGAEASLPRVSNRLANPRIVPCGCARACPLLARAHSPLRVRTSPTASLAHPLPAA